MIATLAFSTELKDGRMCGKKKSNWASMDHLANVIWNCLKIWCRFKCFYLCVWQDVCMGSLEPVLLDPFWHISKKLSYYNLSVQFVIEIFIAHFRQFEVALSHLELTSWLVWVYNNWMRGKDWSWSFS